LVYCLRERVVWRKLYSSASVLQSLKTTSLLRILYSDPDLLFFKDQVFRNHDFCLMNQWIIGALKTKSMLLQ
jgi:hypothetical protein